TNTLKNVSTIQTSNYSNPRAMGTAGNNEKSSWLFIPSIMTGHGHFTAHLFNPLNDPARFYFFNSTAIRYSKLVLKLLYSVVGSEKYWQPFPHTVLQYLAENFVTNPRRLIFRSDIVEHQNIRFLKILYSLINRILSNGCFHFSNKFWHINEHP